MKGYNEKSNPSNYAFHIQESLDHKYAQQSDRKAQTINNYAIASTICNYLNWIFSTQTSKF